MPGMGPCPASSGSFGEKPFTSRTALARDDPRRHVVGIVAGMAFVVEGKLLDRAVPGVEVLEFVVEDPLPITA